MLRVLAAVALAAAPIGPEGVSIPNGPALAPPQNVRVGAKIDGIACQTHEQVLFHIHAHLTIFVRGKARQVPYGIGIGPPRRLAQTQYGPFVVGGSCFMWLHTHAADGVIHTESPIQRTYTLGDFFDVWGQPLTRDRVGSATGRVTAYLNGRAYGGDPRTIPLRKHAQIQLDVGARVAPVHIRFPNGL